MRHEVFRLVRHEGSEYRRWVGRPQRNYGTHEQHVQALDSLENEHVEKQAQAVAYLADTHATHQAEHHATVQHHEEVLTKLNSSHAAVVEDLRSAHRVTHEQHAQALDSLENEHAEKQAQAYGFGYHGVGVSVAPWTGKQLSKLVFSSNSKDLNISKIYKGLPKKFIFPKLRILYFRIAVLFYNIKDKFNI